MTLDLDDILPFLCEKYYSARLSSKEDKVFLKLLKNEEPVFPFYGILKSVFEQEPSPWFQNCNSIDRLIDATKKLEEYLDFNFRYGFSLEISGYFTINGDEFIDIIKKFPDFDFEEITVMDLDYVKNEAIIERIDHTPEFGKIQRFYHGLELAVTCSKETLWCHIQYFAAAKILLKPHHGFSEEDALKQKAYKLMHLAYLFDEVTKNFSSYVTLIKDVKQHEHFVKIRNERYMPYITRPQSVFRSLLETRKFLTENVLITHEDIIEKRIDDLMSSTWQAIEELGIADHKKFRKSFLNSEPQKQLFKRALKYVIQKKKPPIKNPHNMSKTFISDWYVFLCNNIYQESDLKKIHRVLKHIFIDSAEDYNQWSTNLNKNSHFIKIKVKLDSVVADWQNEKA